MPSKSRHEPEPMIGVGGILFDQQNQVLLIRRGKPPAQGLWSVPGGKLEAGEALHECCRREYKEETGLDVNIVSIAAVVERRIENFHYVIIDFLVTLTNAENNTPCPASDVSDAAWVSLEMLETYPLVIGLANIIRRTAEDGLSSGLRDPDETGSDYVIS